MTAHLPVTARPCELAWRALRVAGACACAAVLAGCGPSPATPDGCRAALLPGDLVITEVFADFQATTGDGNDAGREWFEIYNARGEPIDLEGLTIQHSRADGSRPGAHTLAQATIAPGQYFTLGNAAPGHAPAYVDYGYGDDLGDLFNTDGGTLVLSCSDAEIDRVVYGGVKPGHARELTAAQPPDYTLNDDPGQWCLAGAAEFEAGNFGTPGAENDCRPVIVGQCNDGGTMRDAVPPGPGDLVITEVMPSPERATDATGEWIEARVMNDVDLNGVGLDRAGDSARPEVLDSPDCLRVRAGSYLVFARSTVDTENGGLPAGAIHGTFRFSLIPGSAAAPGDVAIVAGTTVVDAVTWTRSTAGAALQLDPGRIDPIANDTESNFCAAQAPYGSGDLGTPGAANTPCPALPPPGSCDDAGTVRAIAAPVAGQLVISEVLANPANVAGVTDAQREWFEVANTGATAFDLNELEVGRIGATGTAVTRVQSARCLPVPPGGFAVLARSADPAVNGMLPAVAATFRFGLVDTAGDIQIARDGVVLDTVRWASVRSGVAAQLDPAHLTATDNDDPARFCAATTAYGDLTNQGTPGAANPACP
ncbi:MAG TPA: lamin tail domain-containing protein [Kofleriaceae bacterium]|nr:lamin tail domain-containing protein [Kofleriaceae bacterium]